MKTTKKHFLIFKKEVLKFIDRFELNNWEICFGLTTKTDILSSLAIRLSGYIATFFLCENWDNRVMPLTEENVRKTAKHEVIHLLLARLAVNGAERFITPDQLTEAEEEVVRKLESIIK